MATFTLSGYRADYDTNDQLVDVSFALLEIQTFTEDVRFTFGYDVIEEEEGFFPNVSLTLPGDAYLSLNDIGTLPGGDGGPDGFYEVGAFEYRGETVYGLTYNTDFNQWSFVLGGADFPTIRSLEDALAAVPFMSNPRVAPVGSGFGPGEDVVIDTDALRNASVTFDDLLDVDDAPIKDFDMGRGRDTVTADVDSHIVDGGDDEDVYIIDENATAAALDIEIIERGFIFRRTFDDGSGGTTTSTFTVTNFEDFYLEGGAGFPLSFEEVRMMAADPAVDLTGDDGDNLLEGTNNDDRLVGGLGNDTLNGDDGRDTLVGGEGDDVILAGATANDLRDFVYGGTGNDQIDGGHGNDELRGDAGNDTIGGGFGVDTIIGGTGDDVLSGGAFSDLIFGGDGADFINGGFGFDRVNGGAGADRFYHLGVRDHGSDWIQDYDAGAGDVLLFGTSGATAADFQVNVAATTGAGADDVDEAFVIYRPTGQILWALVDGAGQTEINLQIAGSAELFDLLA